MKISNISNHPYNTSQQKSQNDSDNSLVCNHGTPHTCNNDNNSMLQNGKFGD